MNARMAALFVAGALTVLPTLARAGISQNTLASPGGFVQAGAYSSTCGCGDWPGTDLAALYGTTPDFHEMSYSGISFAQASAAYSAGSISNSSSADASMGTIGLHAYNTSPNSAPFASSYANGGWKDTITVSHPSLNGQAGYFQFSIHVHGSMMTDGFTGAAGMRIAIYQNQQLVPFNSYFAWGASDVQGTDRQCGGWSLASYGLPDSRTVDGAITFAVPIVFGQPFTLGVYARGLAGQRSSGGVEGNGTGTLDFSGNGVTWAGVLGVYSGGAPVSGYAVGSLSGFDWDAQPPSCDPDYNQDGGADLSDVLDLANDIAAGTESFPPNSSDFNNDGSADLTDVLDLANVVAGGACP